MTIRRIQLGGEEFMRKISEKIRYFSSIRLKEDANLSDHKMFERFNNYMLTLGLDLKYKPVVLSGSSLRGLKANGLHLPYVVADGSDIVGAHLNDAYLLRANFVGARCEETHFNNTSLVWSHLNYAHLNGADLRGADLRGADSYNTDFTDAHLNGADLRGIKNLQYALHLKDAHFKNTKVNKREEVIISKALNVKPSELKGLIRVY